MHGLLLVAGDEDIKQALAAFELRDNGNPDWKFDWFKVGGRFRDALPLRVPRETRRFFGMFAGPITHRAIAAKKKDIDVEALLRRPPAAFLFRGEWTELEMIASDVAVDSWREAFARRFSTVPDEMMITVIDIHRPVS